MPYSSTKELPPAVRSKLKGKRRRQWLHVFNSEYAAHGDESRAFAAAWSTAQKVEKGLEMTDFKFFLPLAKVDKNDDGTCTVTGYASTPTKDMDGEIVTLDAVKKALPAYMEWRNIREMHRLNAVGTAQSASVDDKGLFVTARIVDRDAVKKCLEEVYRGFSVGGRKLDKVGNKITEIDLVEISLVDRPNNPDCKISLVKSAKEVTEGTAGYLLKIRKTRDPKDKALSQMAKAVRTLTKAGPPAARDGFSLPAGPMNKNPSPKDPDTQNNKAADNANPFTIDADAKREKKRLKKEKKKAKKMAKAAAKRAARLGKLAVLELESSEQHQSNSTILEKELTMTAKADSKDGNLELKKGANDAAVADDDLTKAIKLVLAKVGNKEPSRAERIAKAAGALRMAKKARKMAKAAIQDAHGLCKAAYLAKAAKDKKDDDADDNGVAVMEKLQKAYGEIEKLGTFMKAARDELKKVASGLGPADGSEFMEVPSGVKNLSQTDLSHAGPGTKGGGSDPPLMPSDGSVYPGKAAGALDLKKFADKDGNVPAAIVELIMTASASAAKAEALEKLPAATGGRRPYSFDMTKVMAGRDGEAVKDANVVMFKGVDPADLASGDEARHTAATAKVLGNMLLAPSLGKSIIDPDFKGAAGSGRA